MRSGAGGKAPHHLRLESKGGPKKEQKKPIKRNSKPVPRGWRATLRVQKKAQGEKSKKHSSPPPKQTSPSSTPKIKKKLWALGGHEESHRR